MTMRKMRTHNDDSVYVVDMPARSILPGDILRFRVDSLQVATTREVNGRVLISARSARDAGGLVERSYVASYVVAVERA